jgi:hypothetical protein
MDTPRVNAHTTVGAKVGRKLSLKGVGGSGKSLRSWGKVKESCDVRTGFKV